MKYLISYGCVSSPGKLRSVNQDNFICGGRFMESGSAGAQFRGSVDSRERPLFGVFDGLGGEECGAHRGRVRGWTTDQQESGRGPGGVLSGG